MFGFGKSKESKKESENSLFENDGNGLFEESGSSSSANEEISASNTNNNDNNSLTKRLLFATILIVVGLYVLGVYWSFEPDTFDVKAQAKARLTGQEQIKVGYTTVATTEQLVTVLLDKPGGFLSNDRLPPSLFLDNIPAWEFGVMVQIRDIVSVLRNDMSRSQSQSLENSDLQKAEPLFNISTTSWIVPSAEGSYADGLESLKHFRKELVKNENPNVQFYARADNLRAWLELVNKRLGGLSQRLSSAISQDRVNTDLSGDSSAVQSTVTNSDLTVKTDWFKIDDVFYESRGACWALIHLLKAIQIDFDDVLEKKNAKASLAQIIRELESTQETVWSPMILNGSGFGLMANHSLVMANYISRANAGLIDLSELLSRG